MVGNRHVIGLFRVPGISERFLEFCLLLFFASPLRMEKKVPKILS